MTLIAQKIRITGLVQGVGFRPFVYRIAVFNAITGWVANDNLGVIVHAEGRPTNLEAFIVDIKTQLPAAAHLRSVEITSAEPQNFSSFDIRKSDSYNDEVTEVSPDIAVCEDCLADMERQPHRLGYAFTNCTHCGPRFTIIKALPYDRFQTTMEPFALCETCENEYKDVLNRRFHAQPVACNTCGPQYHIAGLEIGFEAIPVFISKLIDEGKIIALKGLGGYHLVCDATNEEAVKRLRHNKNREGKPMAVMMASMSKVEQHFEVNAIEHKALESWQRPIVLLQNRTALAPSVSNRMNTTGIVFPYMPLHHQLFKHLKTPAIVLTSGNVSDEPVIIEDEQALQNLSSIADVIVTYNRKIHNRADDSVAMEAAGVMRIMRRSRGFAPSPITMNLPVEGIFAAGAELVNSFAIGKGTNAILSQHIGDLKNTETLAFYEEAYERFSALFRFNARWVACDLHPDYLSTRLAQKMNLPLIGVQHHHAHIASCMAEHGLDEKVIGIALDGTGLGDDGTIWGGEFFVCDLMDFERKLYFDPVPLPGGDKATEEPWRTAVSYLYLYFGADFPFHEQAFLKEIPPEKLNLLLQAIQLGINCPLSSGAGRLFDAVAALTGLCTQATFHAEAPMLLESAIEIDCKSKYLFEIKDKRIVFMKLFYLIMKDIKNQVPVSVISAKFHNTILTIILKVVKRLSQDSGLKKVVLSGGSFQNRYLLSNSIIMLQEQGFEVFAHENVPTNDGGIALGQMAIAAKRIQNE